jgi:hypothetical protein
MDSMRDPGRLKKNLDLSKTLRVERTLDAFEAFSKTGKKT